jgi:sulfatase maturation enzyme AslB (radical SAM superfamily)
MKFVFYNQKNINKIYRYINFRFFFEQVSLKKYETDYPPYLLIEPVSICNLRCPFCYQSDTSFTKKQFMGTMELDLFKKIIDQANEIGVGAITIASRGEPTLHKDLAEMLRYTRNKENIFEIKLNTNGTKLSENLCHQIFESEVNQLVISADHYEKKTFEELRKNSNFENIVKNVNMLFEIRKKFKNTITEIRVSGIDFYKSTDKNKFHDFWIKISDEVTMGNAVERWDTYNNKIHPDIVDPCENLWDRMYIWFDGKVNPCDADY